MMNEELSMFSSMINTIKEVAFTIRESKPVDFHPSLYSAGMDQGCFSQEALMVALSYLLDNRGTWSWARLHTGRPWGALAWEFG